MSLASDPVVATLDIQFHAWSEGGLHVLSYPLRPSYRPTELPSGVRMRPLRRSMEVVSDRDLASSHFDSRALGDARMRESRLKSSEVPPKGVQLIGIVDGASGVLHVAPLTSLQVMRPDITYLDTALKTPPEGLQLPPRANASQPVKLQTQFRRRDPSTFKAAEAYRRATWAYHVAQDEADAWVDLDVHGPSSASARAVRSNLTSAPPPPQELNLKQREAADTAAASPMDLTVDDAPVEKEIGVAEFLRLVSGPTGRPGDVNGSPAMPVVPSVAAHPVLIATVEAAGSLVPGHSALPMTLVANIPVLAQVEEGLRRAHALPFRRIIELASSARSLAEIVEACESLGRLVRGNWVLKSEVYFGQPWHVKASAAGAAVSGGGGRQRAGVTSSALSTAAITRLAAARDHFLAAFNASPDGCVDAGDGCAATGLSMKAAIAILEKMADVVDEGLYAAEGLQGAAAELASALAGPTIANKNVHMAQRRAGLSGGELRPAYCFKQPVDTQFTSRFPLETERHRKWWDKRVQECALMFATSLLAHAGLEEVGATEAAASTAGTGAGAGVATPAAPAPRTTKGSRR